MTPVVATVVRMSLRMSASDAVVTCTLIVGGADAVGALVVWRPFGDGYLSITHLTE